MCKCKRRVFGDVPVVAWLCYKQGGSVAAGGLGDYGSDESSDEEASNQGSESSDTDEEELRHRIRQKQDAFRRKEREMVMQQEREDLEAAKRGETVGNTQSGRGV